MAFFNIQEILRIDQYVSGLVEGAINSLTYENNMSASLESWRF